MQSAILAIRHTRMQQAGTPEQPRRNHARNRCPVSAFADMKGFGTRQNIDYHALLEVRRADATERRQHIAIYHPARYLIHPPNKPATKALFGLKYSSSGGPTWTISQSRIAAILSPMNIASSA